MNKIASLDMATNIVNIKNKYKNYGDAYLY